MAETTFNGNTESNLRYTHRNFRGRV